MVDKRIRKLAKQARDKRRRAVREFNELALKSRPTSCAACEEPWCCYQVVSCGLVEGVIIADHLLRTRQESLFMAAAEQGSEQLGLVSEGLGDPHALDQASTQWFERREPCAFLVEGRCSIYQSRPIACSCYWAVTPAAECAPPPGKQIASVDHRPMVSWGIAADAAFARAALGNSERTLVAQLPLGYGSPGIPATHGGPCRPSSKSTSACGLGVAKCGVFDHYLRSSSELQRRLTMCYCGGCSQCLADQGWTRADFVDEARELLDMDQDLSKVEAEEFRLWVESLEAEFADTDQLDEVA